MLLKCEGEERISFQIKEFYTKDDMLCFKGKGTHKGDTEMNIQKMCFFLDRLSISVRYLDNTVKITTDTKKCQISATPEFLSFVDKKVLRRKKA